MKRRIISFILSLSLILLTAFSAGSCAGEVSEAINLAALKGPTAMGLAQLATEYAGSDDADYQLTLEALPELIGPKLLQGACDLAALPANLAASLYNKSQGKIQVVAINTLGVLYLAEYGDSVKKVADLKGKTIYAAGKGATPEIILHLILEKNGLDPDRDVELVFVSEHSEVVARMSAGAGSLGLLPEPFLTVASGKNPDIRQAIDLNEAWIEIYGESSPLITGVLVGRKDFLEQNPKRIKTFLERYEKSVSFAQDKTDEAAKLIADLDIFEEAPARKALPNCNIVYMDGAEMKAQLSAYLKTLEEINPQVIGGALPADDFYYLP